MSLVAVVLFFGIGMFVPMTLDASTWYFGRSLVVIGLASALAAWAFWISVAAQPLFGTALLEEE